MEIHYASPRHVDSLLENPDASRTNPGARAWKSRGNLEPPSTPSTLLPRGVAGGGGVRREFEEDQEHDVKDDSKLFKKSFKRRKSAR